MHVTPGLNNCEKHVSHSLLCCIGAHLNPAVSLSFCVLRKVSWTRLLPYSLSQVMGAYVASCLVFLVYYGGFCVNITLYKFAKENNSKCTTNEQYLKLY
jgi:glycerol uptake facilitator-like aquaporin